MNSNGVETSDIFVDFLSYIGIRPLRLRVIWSFRFRLRFRKALCRKPEGLSVSDPVRGPFTQ